jgi:hypothetical protein
LENVLPIFHADFSGQSQAVIQGHWAVRLSLFSCAFPDQIHSLLAPMSVKDLFTAVAAVCMLFGFALAFMPDFIGNQFLTVPSMFTPATRLVAQGHGSCLMAIAIALGYCREVGPSVARKALVLLVLFSNLALVVIHTLAILNGIETAAAFLTVGISVVFASWSGMLLGHNNRRAFLA